MVEIADTRAAAPDRTAARPLAVHQWHVKSVLTPMGPIRRQGASHQIAEWSINPYRGCQHGCAYCYARRTHIQFDLDGAQSFEQEIFVKTGTAELLRAELRRLRHKPWHSPIVIGSAVDPYQPVEGTYQVTRGLLRELCAARAPVSIITKNTMVLRDADLLAELARNSYSAVFMSITTLDADLARHLEPATPPPLQRLRAVRQLVARGIPAGVMVAPIIPWLTDGRGALEALGMAARSHDARWLAAGTLRLHPDVRPVFFDWLRRERPELLATYEHWYARTEPPRIYHDRVHARMAAIRDAAGLPGGPPPMHLEPERPVQGTLFDA